MCENTSSLIQNPIFQRGPNIKSSFSQNFQNVTYDLMLPKGRNVFQYRDFTVFADKQCTL